MSQDDFYFSTEANDFFDRWQSSAGRNYNGDLRENKQSILSVLTDNIDLKGLRVLEVGCFISDLLATLEKEYSCKVSGVEASAKACEMAKSLFGIKIENSSFIASILFGLNAEQKGEFDLIIFDDVLSWMGRENILQVIAVTDWLLKDGGSIFIRDFSPVFAFAFENHHKKGRGVYNFKQPNGHRQLFLNSGKYFERYTKIYTDYSMQKIETTRADSATWADSLITKTKHPLHPIIEM
jgi:cyclopropane fatty-acyl-phospholipid synthase-like methyltransferase